MGPIRVLHCLGGLNDGGMGTLLMNYLRTINRDIVIFDFLVFEGDGFFDEEAKSLGSKIYKVPSRRYHLFKHYKAVDAFFDQHKEYKIVHIHQGVTYYYMLQSAYMHNVPVRIIHCHGVDQKHRKYLGWFLNIYAKRKICSMATDFFTCANYVSSQLFVKKILTQNKVKLLQNAIKSDDFIFNNNTRKKMRELLDIDENTIIFGHIGKFLYPKNHSFLIEIFNEIVKIKPNSKLLLLGEGKLRNSIENKVAMYGLSQKVLFLGSVRNVNEYLQAMDAVIMPSLFEGLPVSGVEAQASGLPVFISDTVTSELNLFGNVIYLSLRDSCNKWAVSILNYMRSFQRKNCKDNIIQSGYDIEERALYLEKYYVKKYEGINQ